jgi:hypothetical protein
MPSSSKDRTAVPDRASPLADIWSLDGDLQRPHAPLHSRRLAVSARHLPSRPAGSACRLAGSFARRPRRLARSCLPSRGAFPRLSRRHSFSPILF